MSATGPGHRGLLYATARQLAKAARERELLPAARDLARYGAAWRRSNLDPGGGTLAARQPWLPYRAIDRIDDLLHPGARVFEWGSGGSTLFLLDRAGEVVSVEHDRGWGESVREAVGDDPRWTFHLHPPQPGDDPAFASEQRPGMSFAEYVTAIDAHAAGGFDLVMVDGRARIACLRRAADAVRPGGHLVLDNAERPRYREAATILAGWEEHRVFGPAAFSPSFWRTTFWRRPTA